MLNHRVLQNPDIPIPSVCTTIGHNILSSSYSGFNDHDFGCANPLQIPGRLSKYLLFLCSQISLRKLQYFALRPNLAIIFGHLFPNWSLICSQFITILSPPQIYQKWVWQHFIVYGQEIIFERSINGTGLRLRFQTIYLYPFLIYFFIVEPMSICLCMSKWPNLHTKW